MIAPKSQGSILETIGKFFAPAIFFFVFMEATSVLCISKAVDENGNRIYNSATVVLVQEILKLIVSVIGLWYEDPGFVQFRQNISISALVKSSIPAALYALNNNIFLVVLTLMNPSVFQLMLNMRVVWTGLIFRFLLGRPVTKKQWMALIILVIGCSIAQTATTATSSSTNADDLNTEPSSFSDFINAIDPKLLLGFALTMVYTVVSTTAGVVNEVVLKSGESFNSSNVKLYFFGVVFNLIALYHQGGGSGGYFRGWEHKIVWVIVTFMAVIGMLVARIMQKYDNIVKIFCVAAANFVVYTYSVVYDSYPLSGGFVVAFLMVSAAAYMYQQEKNRMDNASKTVVNDTNAGTISTSIYAKVGDADEEGASGVVANISDLDDFSDSDFEGHVQGMQLKVIGGKDE